MAGRAGPLLVKLDAVGFNSGHEIYASSSLGDFGSRWRGPGYPSPFLRPLEALRMTVAAAPSVQTTAAVIVSYQPDSEFDAHLQLLLSEFDAVFLVDNTGAGAGHIVTHPRLHFHSNDINQGLGVALNQGCQLALDAGYEWVVTLDQDSRLEVDFVPMMIAAWSRSSVCPVLLGCNYFSVSRGLHKITADSAAAPIPVATVITSGTLMHLDSWRSLGGFREEFFIDGIDHEICLRARNAGCLVALYPGSMMRHSIGEEYDSGSWLGGMRPYRHSPLRDYTNARNTTRLLLEYVLREPRWCLRRSLGFAAELLAVLVFETNKLRRLKCLVFGIGHGIAGKMDDFPEFVRDG
ncbi:glycosyltransferase [Halieaceae bacterium IMCC14734]|uniref:Glycosyltransferase n=1 Tax=Candidatus Litorirhabdus singularis TaxID=2518993 RepID=A0ABT3TJP2_9GAMM|nr:glycosyltransferase [Candidatus Litorirhabdus singularis]MCX2982538.1 glycosyltransferase [Candidatus Litorirhabdus singularis]